MEKLLCIYELENDLLYHCDDQERHFHINRLKAMKTREEQEEYIELFSDIIEKC